MLGEAPGTARLSEWVTAVDDGMTLEDLANHIENSDAFQAIYPNFLTEEQFAEDFQGSLKGDEGVSAVPMPKAVDFVVGLLNGGMSHGELSLAAVNACSASPRTRITCLEARARTRSRRSRGPLVQPDPGGGALHDRRRMADPSSSVLDGVSSVCAAPVAIGGRWSACHGPAYAVEVERTA